MITGKLYDRLKFLAQILLPALGTFYFTLAQIWGLAAGEEVLGTIVAFDLFLGAILGISQMAYAKQVDSGGTVLVAPNGKTAFQLDGIDVDNIGDKKEVRFVVKEMPMGGPGEDEQGTPG